MSTSPETPQSLQHWLLTEGRRCDSVPRFVEALSARLEKALPLDRMFCGTTVLHPQAAAWAWIWTPGAEVRALALTFADFQRLSKRDSPVRRLERGAEEVYWSAEMGPSGMLDIDELMAEGFTAFLALSVHFKGKWVGAFTFATQHAEGFSSEQLALLRTSQYALAAVLQPLAQDLVTSSLLRTYLGQDAGQRVFRGNVQRGEGELLRAAVWMSDVRRFTWLSTQLDPPALLHLLNQSFEITVEVVEAHSGEVLKFMGDGLLAVFPGEGDAACANALKAALALRERLAQLRADRAARGQVFTDVGVGLHYGDVNYGNIGAPGRLDFTVIGSAVNLAARIEGLCASLEQSILASDAFRRRTAGAWTGCGRHSLKGVDQPVEIFAPLSAG